MVGPDQVKVACPACGKQYHWKPQYASRKVKCSCGRIIRMPTDGTGKPTLVDAVASSSPGSAAKAPPVSVKTPAPVKDTSSTRDIHSGGEVNPYDLHDSHLEVPGPSKVSAKPAGKSKGKPAAARTPGKCPNCGNKITPTAIICVSCGFNLQSGERINTAIEDDGAAPAVRPAAGKPAQDAPFSRLNPKPVTGEPYPKANSSLKAAVISLVFPLISGILVAASLKIPKQSSLLLAGAISGLVIGAIWAYSVVKMARNAAEDIKDSGGRLTGIPATKQAETVSAISLVINAFSLCGVLLWKLYFSG